MAAKRKKKKSTRPLERISGAVTRWTGGSSAFAIAAAIVIIWGITGPIFNYSNSWQLVINTGTTIVTFLMVFLIQRSQNKDSLAIQLKLNELVASSEHASNRLIDVEALDEDELKLLHRYYQTLVALAKADVDLGQSHTVEEAEGHAALKARALKHRGTKRKA